MARAFLWLTGGTALVIASLSPSLLPAADAPAADPKQERLDLFEEEVDITNSLQAVMVWIPAGLRVAKTEVTQAQYQKVMGKNPSRFNGPNRPVETVSPAEAATFCRKLTQQELEEEVLPEGYAYGLPTEQEFTGYVANTPLETAFVSWVGDRLATTDVAALPANELGLYDVRGNVWEWCDNSVARGASYQSHEDYLDPAFRFVGNADMRVMDIGFRVVLRGGATASAEE